MLTVRETLELFATISQHIINEAFINSGIISDTILDVPIIALSGGHKKRLLVAIATMYSPTALFIDEATSGVDADARNAICNYLKQHSMSKQALIFSSHRMEESISLCDRVVILRNGKVAFEDQAIRVSQRMNLFYAVDVCLVNDIEDVTSLHRLIQMKLIELGLHYASGCPTYFEECTQFSKTIFRFIFLKEKTPVTIIWDALELSSNFISTFSFRDVVLEELALATLNSDAY